MNVGIFRSVNTHIQDGVVKIICKKKIEENNPENIAGFAKKVEVYMNGIQILKCTEFGRDNSGKPYYRYTMTQLVSGTYNLKIV